MFLLLFLLIFIANLVVAKIIFKSYFSPLGVYGSIWMGGLFVSQLQIVNYNALDMLTVFIYVINYFSFFVGCVMALLKRNTCNVRSQDDMIKISDIHVKRFEKLITLLVIVSLLSTLYKWYILIRHYGSLGYIFHNAFMVRMELINNPEAPVSSIVSYLASLVNAAAALSSIYIFYVTPKKIITYFPIGISFLIDLTTFGRVTTIWTILLYVAGYLTSHIAKKTKLNLRTVGTLMIILMAVLVMLSIPRLVRGNFDEFSGTVRNYGDHILVDTKDNLIYNGLLTFYVYGTGSFFAFNEYMKDYSSVEMTNGMALFTPFYKLLKKIGLFQDSEYSYLYAPAKIPFAFNVYTFLREVYSDLGFGGFVIVPMFLGLLSTFIMNRLKETFHMALLILQIYLYMFFLFSIIYNPFSFGINVIGLGTSILIAIVIDKKSERCYYHGR